jgi:uncharacterized protein DUF5335
MRHETAGSESGASTSGTVTQPTATQTTTKIPRDRLAAYFDAFTKRFLRDDSPEALDVEVVGPTLGDQYAIRGLRLAGITYDPRTDALEFAVELDDREVGDHRIYAPQEVWAIEEQNGFLSAVEVVRPDGSREIITVRRAGDRRADA